MCFKLRLCTWNTAQQWLMECIGHNHIWRRTPSLYQKQHNGWPSLTPVTVHSGSESFCCSVHHTNITREVNQGSYGFYILFLTKATAPLSYMIQHIHKKTQFHRIMCTSAAWQASAALPQPGHTPQKFYMSLSSAKRPYVEYMPYTHKVLEWLC